MKPASFKSKDRGSTALSRGAAVLFLAALGVLAALPGIDLREAQAQSSGAAMGHEPFAQPGSSVTTGVGPTPAAEAIPSAQPYVAESPPVHDNMIFGHVLFNQLEGRSNGPENELRWDGEAWVGTDWNRLWFKSEGFFNSEGHGKLDDGIHEVLYDRPIWFLRYFDWQLGLRYDGDSSPPRYWGAFGIEGLAPEFFEFEATLYVRDAGHFAARVTGLYDVFLTNRLILQPQFELNFYSKEDRSRAVGRGLSELDAGLRLRYEISRKFAPYMGFAYTQQVGGTGILVRREGDIVYDPRVVFGIRTWY